MNQSARQLAFLALRSIEKGAFADVAVDQALHQTQLNAPDRRLLTELVYGTIRRQRTLDTLIDQLATKPADQQPSDLRLLLHLGFYQLRYLSQIPESAAVNTTVDLAKHNGFPGLTGFVNGLLRQYIRLTESGDPLKLPSDRAAQLGLLHSIPDWIVQVWVDQFGIDETDRLCQWMNQPPPIDLRVNTLRASIDQVETALQDANISVNRIPHLPQALRLSNSGAIQNLPGYSEGWWIVQDSSAQLVGYLLDPQPGETIVDACAAPGGKTVHIAELMNDRGTVLAFDRTASRLKKLKQTIDRLGLHAIDLQTADSRDLPNLVSNCDRILVDAPCSGLGTLNRHADARWRQTPENVQDLSQLQQELLTAAAACVKPTGTIVYATCTLHPLENESVITTFLTQNPEWTIDRPDDTSPIAPFLSPQGWVKVLPHQHKMDGFFMVRLKRRDP